MKVKHAHQQVEKSMPERVKYLEGENRKLAEEIESLKKTINDLVPKPAEIENE